MSEPYMSWMNNKETALLQPRGAGWEISQYNELKKGREGTDCDPRVIQVGKKFGFQIILDEMDFGLTLLNLWSKVGLMVQPQNALYSHNSPQKWYLSNLTCHSQALVS